MQPVTYYAQTPEINTLVNRYGSQFQGISREDKMFLLACLTSKLATGYPIESFAGQLKTFESDDETLEDFTLRLDRLEDDDLLGVCEALINQLRYGR